MFVFLSIHILLSIGSNIHSLYINASNCSHLIKPVQTNSSWTFTIPTDTLQLKIYPTPFSAHKTVLNYQPMLSSAVYNSWTSHQFLALLQLERGSAPTFVPIITMPLIFHVPYSSSVSITSSSLSCIASFNVSPIPEHISHLFRVYNKDTRFFILPFLPSSYLNHSPP